MFVDLLKPKWRHPSAAVRRIAATKLNPDNKSDAVKLRQLAFHDPDLEVRSAATTRLMDPQLLTQLLEQNEYSTLSELAAARLITLTEQGLINPKQLESVRDETALSLLICSSQSEALHHVLISRVHDENLLANIAMRAPLTATRQLAAAQLNDTDCIEKVRNFAKDHDKLVYRITREAQKRCQQLQLEQQVKQRECHKLIDALHNLVHSGDRQHFSARFHALQNHWNELAGSQQPDVTDTYQQLVSQAEAIEQQQTEQQALVAEASAARVLADQQLTLCQGLLAELLQQLSQHSVVNNEIKLELDRLDNETQPLLTTHAEQLTTAQRRELDKIIAIISACQALQQQSSSFYSLIEQADAAHDLNGLQTSLQAIQQSLQQPDWPPTLKVALDFKALSAAEQQTAKRLQRLKQQDKMVLAALEDQLNALDSHIKQGETLKAQEKLDSLNKQIKKQPLTEPLQQQFRNLTAQVNEIAEWQQFSAVAKKEQLCMAMEALIDSRLAPAALAEQIRELQLQWKQLDQQSTTALKPLWDRFHTASRQAYEPCDAYYKELSRIRAWNLSQRELICQHLETYFNALDWTRPDWRALELILKKAKHEWRGFSPVDRAPGKLLQARFQHLIDQAEQALQAHRIDCAAQKQALVDEALELTQAEDAVAAAEGIKALQQAWKKIDTTAKHKERKLWEAFRRHGDQVFARIRDRSQPEDQHTTEQHPDTGLETAARLLCIRLEILFNQPSPDNDQYLRMEYQMQRLQEALEPCSDSEREVAVQQVVNEWHEAGLVDQFDALQQRFTNLLTLND